jgi:hypothetical protein
MLLGFLIILIIAWIIFGSLQEIAAALFWTVIIVLLIGALLEGIRWIKGRRGGSAV